MFSRRLSSPLKKSVAVVTAAAVLAVMPGAVSGLSGPKCERPKAAKRSSKAHAAVPVRPPSPAALAMRASGPKDTGKKPARDTKKGGKKANKPLPDWVFSPAMKRHRQGWMEEYRWWVRAAFQLGIWTVVVVIGRQGWKWGQTRKFLLKDDRWFEESPDLDGGADKFGHTIGMYLLNRGYSWVWLNTGGSRWAAVLTGTLTSVAVGFSYTDIIFNMIGTVLGALQDAIPALDPLYSMSIFWFPSQGFFSSKNPSKQDMLTDYSGTKHFFHILLAGIPYVNRTFARYLRLDLAYWTRGFKKYDRGYTDDPEKFNAKRVVYFGVSIDFAQLVMDLWPKKWYRTSTAIFLKYVNLYGPFETGFKLVF
jgi:hypothetical protein